MLVVACLLVAARVSAHPVPFSFVDVHIDRNALNVTLVAHIFDLAHDLNVTPQEAIMVGDWPERDVVGASKLGIRTAFARYGDTFGTERSGADYDLNDVYELVEIVDRLNGSD